jgi:hypothetical protein
MRKIVCSLQLIACFCLCSLTASAQYTDVRKGDIIEIDGIKAIVWQVDETGQHGCAMSVKALRGVDDAWCKNKEVADRLPVMNDDSDGLANTQALCVFAEKDGIPLADFPAFEWCKQLGPDWYIPSVKELEGFINFWVGNEQDMDWNIDDETEQALDNERPYYKQVNNKMLDAGGISFINGVFTSTINADGKVYVFSFNRKKNTWSFHKRNPLRVGKYMVARAFHRF